MASHLVSIEMNTTGIFLPVSKHMSSFFFYFLFLMNACLVMHVAVYLVPYVVDGSRSF